jgi:HprK-related kinase A
MTGMSGAGKSTLSALLGERGWRFMGDEFALIEPNTGRAHGFPRAISLKNEAVAVMQALVGASDRFGPLLTNTPKGMIRHLMPGPDAIDRMDKPARPALLLFPRFGHQSAIRSIGAAEVFMRLTQSSTNYVALGEAGFRALTQLVSQVPARAIDYEDTDSAIALVEQLWAELA